MSSPNSNSKNSSITMDQLMSSMGSIKSFNRGDEVEGGIVNITSSEVIVDLGGKTEGVLEKKEVLANKEVKVGDKIRAFVIISENESGQIILSLYPETAKESSPRDKRGFSSNKRGFSTDKNWQRFSQAQNQNSKLTGKVIEVNKGGLICEVDRIRGFLPTSQIGFETLTLAGAKTGLEGLINQDLTLTVIEVDPKNNRLIFSNRAEVKKEIQDSLEQFKEGQKVEAKVIAIVPFGIIVSLENNLEGIIFSSEAAWEKQEDLSKLFEIGQQISTQVLSIDKNLGRINLSVKQLTKDPMEEVLQNYQPDDVVKGIVMEVNQNGVLVNLETGGEGFIPTEKIESEANYTLGQTTNFLVDSVDKAKRRINLTPFLTSTKGLIYR